MNTLSVGNLMPLAQLLQTDQIQTEQTALQMAAQKQKYAWEKWKLFQDLQTEIYETQQEVCLHRAKSQDKIFNKWDDYIRG